MNRDLIVKSDPEILGGTPVLQVRVSPFEAYPIIWRPEIQLTIFSKAFPASGAIK